MIKLYIIADEIKPVGLHKNFELFNIEVTWIIFYPFKQCWKCYKLWKINKLTKFKVNGTVSA